MEIVKIIFFILGSFFGVENSRILAEKTVVTINPKEKTIVIIQENIVALIRNDEDSLKVSTELKMITQPQQPWSKEFKDYTKKEKCLYISEDDDATLNSKISLTYKNETDLKAFGINLNSDGKLSMMDIPESHIKSDYGNLGERYWNFDADKIFTFSIEPLIDIPNGYKIHKKSLLAMWQTK